MKKLLSYLFLVFGVFAYAACGGGASEEVENQESMVCANKGEPCLEDHSCCATFVDSDEVGSSEEETAAEVQNHADDAQKHED